MDIDKAISTGAGLCGRRLPAGAARGIVADRVPARPGLWCPTYLQLVHQVEHALRLGYLKPDDQLPKVRDVVATLAINPNTVLKAYKELEVKGLAAGQARARSSGPR